MPVGWIPAWKGVFHSESGDALPHHSFRVARNRLGIPRVARSTRWTTTSHSMRRYASGHTSSRRAEPCKRAASTGFTRDNEKHHYDSWIRWDSCRCGPIVSGLNSEGGARLTIHFAPRNATGAAASCEILKICARLG